MNDLLVSRKLTVIFEVVWPKWLNIFEIKIPDENFKEVSPEGMVKINEKIKECELEIKKLSELLTSKGYYQAE